MHWQPRLGPVAPIEYAILGNTRNAGEIVASFQGVAVYQTVIDQFGRHYAYKGLAPRLASGEFDVKALGRAEFILPPGLVYRCEG
jgi:hypothetical protein